MRFLCQTRLQTLNRKFTNLIEESYKLRDESNELINGAQALLRTALQLPHIEELWNQVEQFDKNASVFNFSVPLSEVVDRLDSSYYVPIVKTIEQHIARTANEIIKVGDRQISQSVVLPTRFKRVYVEEGNGVVFFGGKQLYELDPSNKKYLSISQHGNRIADDLKIHTNSILITRSGTIGKVAICPRTLEWMDSKRTYYQDSTCRR